MPCNTVTVEVNFVTAGSGPNTFEFGWREKGTIAYTTSQLQLNGGTPNTVSFSPTCTSGCNAKVYEGYLKSLCDPTGNTTIYFEALVPDPDEVDCYQYEWVCTNVPIASINISAGGQNYLVGDQIVVQGGGGSGVVAEVSAVVGTGVVSAITITDYGSGYTSVPTAGVDNQVSGGSGAVLSVVLDSCVTLDHLYCAGATTATVELGLGESYVECSNETDYSNKFAGLSADEKLQFDINVVGTSCECADCGELDITNNSAVDPLTIVYNTCNATSPAGEIVEVVIAPLGNHVSTCQVLCNTVTAVTPNANYTINSCTTCIP